MTEGHPDAGGQLRRLHEDGLGHREVDACRCGDVDAVRAIYREYSRSDAEDLAATLTGRLREVTDEFLIFENRNRPDVLEQITGPSIAPE